MTRLYVVRHGNTFERGEAPRRIGARTDLPLTAAGRAQAEALGRHLRVRRSGSARALSAASCKRTRATAEAILTRQSTRWRSSTPSSSPRSITGPTRTSPESAVLARIGRSALELWETELVPPPGWDAGAEWRLPAWRDFAEGMRGRRGRSCSSPATERRGSRSRRSG